MPVENVLVVDDNPAILKSLDTILRRWKFSPFLATQGKQALEIFKEKKPELVLIDVLLPGMNGLNAIEKMKEMDENFSPIVMTGNPARDFIIRSLKAGAADFLIKPFSAIQLRKSIDKAISKKLEIDNQKLENKSLNQLVQSKAEEITLMKKELFHLRKMATVGELSGGLVHEINQPLGSMILNCQELIMQIDEKKEFNSKEMKTYLEEMLGQMDLIVKIVRNMRSFSRGDENEAPESFDLNGLLQTTITFIENQFIKHNIELSLKLSENLPQITSRPVGIQQVVMNLLSNARDALSSSEVSNRSIVLSTQETVLDNQTPAVMITIKDNGTGIPDSIKEKIFLPLFTTKDRDHGTGLGLAISKEIVEELGGKIEFESSLNHGTSFSIILPLTLTESLILKKAA
ncbi:MAG: response regulator [Elusimicrobiota bacterium]